VENILKCTLNPRFHKWMYISPTSGFQQRVQSANPTGYIKIIKCYLLPKITDVKMKWNSLPKTQLITWSYYVLWQNRVW